MKLKHLLIGTFIFLSAVPLLIGMQYLHQVTSGHYRFQIEEKLSALSLIAKKRILAVAERIKDSSALVSSRAEMRVSLDQWQKTGEVQYLNRILDIISDVQVGMTNLYDITIYDSDGRMVTSTWTGLEDAVDLDLSSVKQLPSITLEQGNGELLLINLDRLTLQDRTIGYARTRFYADVIVDLLQDRTGLGESGEWLFAVRHESGDALFVLPLKYDPDAAFTRRVSRDRVDVPIIQAMMGNEMIMHEAPDYTNEPVLASTRYVPELDWGLVTKMRESEVEKLIDETSVVIYAIETITITLALVIGIVLSFFISRPLEKLSAHTGKVAKGRFIPYPYGQGAQEIQDLTSHFNYMIGALKDLNDNLQQKVLERTAELDEANKKLRELSVTDELSGLFNRRYINDILNKEINRSKRYGLHLTFVMLDIDHFKQVNDKWGHDVGDTVIRELSACLKSVARTSDTVGRLGGEEFCLVLPETTPEASQAILERMRKTIATKIYYPRGLDGPTFFITCSFGVTELNAEHDTRDTLMKRADEALYKAKNDGRNRVIVQNFSSVA